MAKFQFNAKSYLTYCVEVEAKTPEEANEKAAAYYQSHKFITDFRKKATFSEMKLAVTGNYKEPIKTRPNGKTFVQKFIEWHNGLLPGTEYTNKDVVKAIGCKSVQSFNTMKCYSPAVKQLLIEDQLTYKANGIGKTILYRKGEVAA